MADNTANSPYKNIDESQMFVDDSSMQTEKPISAPVRRRRRPTEQVTETQIIEQVDAIPIGNQVDNTQHVSTDQWKNRRRMAWVSMLMMVALSGALFFIQDPIKIQQIGVAYTIIFPSFASIVGFYMGSVVWSSIKGK